MFGLGFFNLLYSLSTSLICNIVIVHPGLVVGKQNIQLQSRRTEQYAFIIFIFQEFSQTL